MALPPRPLALLLALALVAGLAAPAWASPSSRFEGRLVSPEGRPLEGALVEAIGRPGRATSGDEGRFELPSVGPPPFTLLVTLQDGRAVAVDVVARQPSGATELVVDPKLSASVSAFAGGEESLVTAPGTLASRVDPQAAAERGDVNVQQSLSRLPGTRVPDADPDAVPALRGLGRGRTLVVLDGAPLGGERRAGLSAGQALASSYGGLEVARGPNAVRYGSSAMGGVIALSSPWAAPGGKRRWGFELEGRAGDQSGGAAHFRYSEEGWSAFGGLRRASDPEGADGRELEGEFEQRSAFVGRAWKRGETTWRAGVRVDTLDDADRLALSAETGRTLVPSDRVTRAVLRGERRFEIGSGALVAWFGEGLRHTVLEGGLELPSEDPRDLGTKTRQKDLGLRASLDGAEGAWVYGVGAELGARLGVRVDNVVEDAESGTAPALLAGRALDDGLQADASLFGVVARPLGERFALHLGFRGQRVETRADAGGESYSEGAFAWAGSAALSFELGARDTLALQASRGYREPLLTERYLTGITGRGVAVANPGLEPEVSRQLDLAWRRAWTGGRFVASAFRYRIEDVVVRDFLGSDALPPGFGELGVDVYRFKNEGTATIEGVELEAEFSLAEALDLRLTAHRLRGEDGEGTPLSDLPADGLGAHLEARLSSRARLVGSLLWRDRDEELARREVVTPSFLRADLSASLRVGGDVELRAGVRNLFDEEIALGARPDDPIGPGRVYVLTLSFTE